MAKKNSYSKNLENLRNQIQSNLPNFLLGATIIIVFILLTSLYVQGSKKATETMAKKQSFVEWLIGKKPEAVKTEKKQETHKVMPGENLWAISEKYYGSGFNAYDVARANNIENANVVIEGQMLVIPEVSPKPSTVGEVVAVATEKVTMHDSTYVVKDGDSLWTIAQGAYGDGYAWARIARANELANPDIIYPGQVLNLPR